jgi:hypothetical protein
MRLSDRIRRTINIHDLASVRRGFSRLWSTFQNAPPTLQSQLLEVSEHLRAQLKGDNYDWKLLLKRIDGLLHLMRKSK